MTLDQTSAVSQYRLIHQTCLACRRFQVLIRSEITMSRARLLKTACLIVAFSTAGVVCSAEAGQTPLERTNAGSRLYAVTPAMMHAIDVIVAEKMKMMHRRR